MPYDDLRGFLAALADADEVRTVRGADWDLELGTIDELNYERRGPALLFDEIGGYPAGFRVLTNTTVTKRRASIALGFDPDVPEEEALTRIEEMLKSARPVPPVEVKTGPLMQNVFTGQDINLLKFPTPRWHENDGGRYLGTGCCVILRDPDSGQVNYGAYRVMVHDANTTGLYITPSHVGAVIRRKYWQRGRSAPVAVSFGQDPIIFLTGTQDLTVKGGMPKYDLAGHVRGAPVEVIREEVTGLPVPAGSEIVIAGECPPPDVETRDEGPFAEWTGYYASGMRPEPVIRVRALYHRDDPIIFGCAPFKSRDSHIHFGLPASGKSEREELIARGIPDVLDVVHLGLPGFHVIQIRQRYPGHAMQAALAMTGKYMGRFVVVVDEDINPHDPEDVLWAMGTRCDPAGDITTVPGGRSSWLDPRLEPEKKRQGDFTSSRAIVLACKPFHWKDQFPKTNVASPELRAQIMGKWREVLASK